MNKQSSSLYKMLVLAMLVAIGVVISPILRVEGMCPMAHLINIVCSVLLGPWWSLLCATLIGIIRMVTMAIPPIALTGAIFGAFLSGVFYRASRGNLLMAVLGEIIGTGIIGAIMSYPVMTFLWGREGLSWVFYIPSFVCGTLIGGSIAYLLLKKLAKSGALAKMQGSLGTASYGDRSSVLGSAVTVAALGAIGFTVVEILDGLMEAELSPVSYGLLIAFGGAALLYLAVQLWKRSAVKTSGDAVEKGTEKEEVKG